MNQTSIKFHHPDIDYATNNVGEKGKPVGQGFAYDSGTNRHFLNVEELVEFNRASGI